MSQQITQAVNADSYKSIKAVINKKSILCGMEHICQRYGKTMPRMPSKSSLCPVEKAGRALGCVTPRDKRQSGEHCFAHPLKFCVAFRSLSLVQSSNVRAFGGKTPCKPKSFRSVSFQKGLAWLHRKQYQANLGYVPLKPLDLYVEQEGSGLALGAVKCEIALC